VVYNYYDDKIHRHSAEKYSAKKGKLEHLWDFVSVRVGLAAVNTDVN
jgi:hypothetical protein